MASRARPQALRRAALRTAHLAAARRSPGARPARAIRGGTRPARQRAPRRARRESRAAGKAVRRMAESGATILAGPWLGPPSLELMYWIPLLNRMGVTGRVDRTRVIAVSRGGADPWYADVAGAYVDALDHLDPKEVERLGRLPLDHPDVAEASDLLMKAAVPGGRRDTVEWLHPTILEQLFAPHWTWREGNGVVRTFTHHRLLPDDGRSSSVSERPY